MKYVFFLFLFNENTDNEEISTNLETTNEYLINSILSNNTTSNNNNTSLNENPAPVIAEKPKPQKHYTFEKVSKYSEHLNIQDDEDGHLIYVPGDLLKQRCNLNELFRKLKEFLLLKHLI